MVTSILICLLCSVFGLNLVSHNEMRGLISRLNPSCVLSDVDGTLLNSNHCLTQKTEESIKTIVNCDAMPFFLCTGRNRLSMTLAVGDSIIRAFSPPGKLDIHNIPGVFQQGLMVYNNNELIYERCLSKEDPEVIEIVVKFSKAMNLALIAYCGERIVCEKRCKNTDSIIVYKEPAPDIYPAGLQNLYDSKTFIHKMILLEEDSLLQRIRPALEKELSNRATLTSAVPGMLEVLPHRSNKGEGVKKLLEHYEIDPSRVIAFGDGENDVEMLQLAGLGVALGNARDVLKSEADAVLQTSNDDDTVATMLDHIVASSCGGVR
jgi:Cof subfamily protein (haloacid dehalogenase superfamily)